MHESPSSRRFFLHRVLSQREMWVPRRFYSCKTLLPTLFHSRRFFSFLFLLFAFSFCARRGKSEEWKNHRKLNRKGKTLIKKKSRSYEGTHDETVERGQNVMGGGGEQNVTKIKFNQLSFREILKSVLQCMQFKLYFFFSVVKWMINAIYRFKKCFFFFFMVVIAESTDSWMKWFKRFVSSVKCPSEQTQSGEVICIISV